MKEQELISVIISAYNIENYLPRCLETVSAQSYQNLEIILVDDGSTDTTFAICDEFAKNDSRACVIHQQNAGLWAARNAGQRIAHGNYLMYVDGDDYLHLDAIRVMYETINSNGGYDLAMVDRKFTESLNEDITIKGDNIHTELSQEEIIKNMFKHEDCTLFVYQWNKLYRRKLIEDIWSREYMRSQDFDFNFRVYLNLNKAVWIHRNLYYYVQRSTSLVKTADAWLIYYECRTRLFYQNLINLPSDKQQYAHYLLEDLYKKMAEMKYLYKHGKNKEKVFQLCHSYEKDTLQAYWKSPQISFVEKSLRTLQLHNLWLTKWVLATKRLLMKLGLKKQQ